MADRGTFSDASTTSSAPHALSAKDGGGLSHDFQEWKQEQLKKLQAIKKGVEEMAPNNKVEAAAIGALAMGAVAIDVATHGELHKAARALAPETAARATGMAEKFDVFAKSGKALFTADHIQIGAFERATMHADTDSRLKAAQDLLASSKPKAISMGDLQGWKDVELKNEIKADKVIRGWTADLRETMGAHAQVQQDLQIANRDVTQLSTELKGLKQLRSETVDSELTAESSPALKRVKSAQQNIRDLATDGTPDERAAARRSFDAAKENFEKAKAAAPTRIGQIEGVDGKPGLLPRVEAHVTALQTQAAAHLDTIGDVSSRTQTRMDSLRESRLFEKPTSAEDQALRKREQGNFTPKPARSILTAEERTGIAAPPAKPVEYKAASPVAETARPATAAAERVAPSRTTAIAEAPFTARRVETPVVEAPAVFKAPAPEIVKDIPAKPVLRDATTTVKDTSGIASIDNSLAAAEAKVSAFTSGKGNLRNTLLGVNQYADSVSQALKAERDWDVRSDIVAGAVKNMERLLKPITPPGKALYPVAEGFQHLNDDKKFLHLQSTIERRLAGIEKAHQARTPEKAITEGEQGAVTQAEKKPEVAPRPANDRSFAPQVSAKTREAIESFAQVQSEIPKDARIYAVRTDGTIVDVAIPSNREPGVTRIVPKRVDVAQVGDLGAQSVLGRNFGKGNDIGGFVIVETKRDAAGASIIANSNAVRAASQAGQRVEAIPDQVVSRVIGTVPDSVAKPGSSFLDFVAKFKAQNAPKG